MDLLVGGAVVPGDKVCVEGYEGVITADGRIRCGDWVSGAGHRGPQEFL
jgi:hypothetical protein